jgi:hypothetical protein
VFKYEKKWAAGGEGDDSWQEEWFVLKAETTEKALEALGERFKFYGGRENCFRRPHYFSENKKHSVLVNGYSFNTIYQGSSEEIKFSLQEIVSAGHCARLFHFLLVASG